jgi:hypothetical protein
MKASMDNRTPVVVRMHVECARCGHTEDETYEFDMPFAKSQPIEAYEPGKCPEAPGRSRCTEADAAAAVGAGPLQLTTNTDPLGRRFRL